MLNVRKHKQILQISLHSNWKGFFPIEIRLQSVHFGPTQRISGTGSIDFYLPHCTDLQIRGLFTSVSTELFHNISLV